MSDRAEVPGAAQGEADQEGRELTAVYDGWRCETLGDVEEHERLVDRWAERNPGMVDQSDAEIARERLNMQRRAIEHPRPSTRTNIHTIV